MALFQVSSDAHRAIRRTIRLQNLEDFNHEYEKTIWPAFSRDSQSNYLPSIPCNYTDTSLSPDKTRQCSMDKRVTKRLDSDNIPITAITLHPGTVNTFSDRLPFPHVSRWLMNLLFATPDRGAFTSLIAAASPAVRADPQKYKGAYLQPVGELVEPSDQAKDPKLAEELWRTTENYLEGIGL